MAQAQQDEQAGSPEANSGRKFYRFETRWGYRFFKQEDVKFGELYYKDGTEVRCTFTREPLRWVILGQHADRSSPEYITAYGYPCFLKPDKQDGYWRHAGDELPLIEYKR